MFDQLAPSAPRTSESGRPRAQRIGAAAIAGVILLGCGGGSDSSDPTDVSSTADAASEPITTEPASPATTEASGLDPATLGDEIGVVYLAVYDDVAVTLADRPEPAEAKAILTTLKDDYIERLVSYGYQREELDDAARTIVDSRVRSAVMGVPDESLAAFQEVLDDYFEVDREVWELIGSFNIIGQYAAFDLLREQEPDEAARLGLD